MRAPQAPLENYANKVSTSTTFEAAEIAAEQDQRRKVRRTERYMVRAMCWDCSKLERVRKCGRAPNGTGGVALRLGGGRAGVAGVATCGSVWVCSVCSSKILMRRALEIGTVLLGAQNEGQALGFGTLTMRHRKGQRLDDLWRAGSKAWRRAISGRSWALAQERAGVDGWVRVVEVTQGRNGWHVHFHFVVVLDGSASSVDLEDVCSGMFRRWSNGLQAEGLEAPSRKGQEWHLVGGGAGEVAEYLAKFSEGGFVGSEGQALGLELTHVEAGRSRAGHATFPVWELLHSGSMTGELGPWWEWEVASKGKRQIGWSKGLRERYGLSVTEETDEAIAAEEVGTSNDDLVHFDSEAWRALVGQWWRVPQLLDAAEGGGLRAVRLLLDRWGDVPYTVCVEEAVAA